MPTIRLTPTQLQVLADAASEPGAVCRSESIRSLYECFDRKQGHRKVTAIVGKLADLDLLRIGPDEGWTRPWIVTEAGRKVLADQRRTTDKEN